MGMCYHYELWNEAQKDYNKHDNKGAPNTFFFVGDTSRSIGSYSESITREVYYTISGLVGMFVSIYCTLIGLFAKYACEKM